MSTWIGPEDVILARQQIAAYEARKRERAAAKRLAKANAEQNSAPEKRRFLPFAKVIVRFRKP